MAETIADQNAFNDARHSIRHVKCRILLKYQKKQIEMDKARRSAQPMSGEAGSSWWQRGQRYRNVLDDNEGFGVLSKLCWVLTIFLLYDVLHSLIQYRCSQFGGDKCKYPFDLLPEWMVGSELCFY